MRAFVRMDWMLFASLVKAEVDVTKREQNVARSFKASWQVSSG